MNGICTKVMDFLGINEEKPSLDYLIKVFEAYLQKVPWENATRIIRGSSMPSEYCHRRPAEFWNDIIHSGCGGTCLDGNRALLEFLRELGYGVYMTIGSIADEQKEVHSTPIIELGKQKFIVDIGFPTFAVLPIDKDKETRASANFHSYRVKPLGDDQYEVSMECGTALVPIFLVNDHPVADAEYNEQAKQTYVKRINADTVRIFKLFKGYLLSYNSMKKLKETDNLGTRVINLSDDYIKDVSIRFGIDEDRLRRAHSILGYKV